MQVTHQNGKYCCYCNERIRWMLTMTSPKAKWVRVKPNPQVLSWQCDGNGYLEHVPRGSENA